MGILNCSIPSNLNTIDSMMKKTESHPINSSTCDQLRIDEQMTATLMERSPPSSFPHFILVSILAMTMDRAFLYDKGYVIPLVLNMLGFALRIIFSKLYLKRRHYQSVDQLKWIRRAHHASVILLAVNWGIFVFGVIKEVGLTSYHTTVVIIYMTGVLSMTPYSLGAVPWVRFWFSTIVIGLHMASFALYSGIIEGWTFFGVELIFYLYLKKAGDEYYNEERRRVMRELEKEQSLRELQDIFDALPGYFFLLDKNHIFRSSNNNFANLRSSQSVNGDASEGFKQNALVSKALQFLKEESVSQTEEMEIQIDGKMSWYLVLCRKIHRPFEGVILLASPVDELREAKSALEQQTVKAEHAARMAALGEMAAGIAHEINNPLAIISGNIISLEMSVAHEPIPNNVLLEKLERINQTVQRIGRIVKGLVAFGRDGSKDPLDPTRLRKIVDLTLDLCQERFFRNKVQLIVDEIPEAIVLARPTQISQVLLNLLNNAYDAAVESSEKWVRVSFDGDENYQYICVSDSGKGVDPLVRAKIFDPFFTTKAAGKGTGLGLSISRSIMVDHHGELNLKDQKPTCFELRFPKLHGAKSPLRSA